MFSHGAVGLLLTCRVSPAADSASTMLRTTHCAGRTAQSAKSATTRVCPVQHDVAYTAASVTVKVVRHVYGENKVHKMCTL